MTTASGELQFARGTPSNGSLFPNPDNAYLEASVWFSGGWLDWFDWLGSPAGRTIRTPAG
ncbi:hypothetical protein [Frankia sp. Cppng1_Ct_nod]|uniref:hypothetical protein n=1 Tax=Frankia sp. Cppng1_Ct_nod TaxID=2897162 RepID=UPI00202526CE|nr:hypothetical protein [Frankia sp. Cppng1_Ct_nod]